MKAPGTQADTMATAVDPTEASTLVPAAPATALIFINSRISLIEKPADVSSTIEMLDFSGFEVFSYRFLISSALLSAIS